MRCGHPVQACGGAPATRASLRYTWTRVALPYFLPGAYSSYPSAVIMEYLCPDCPADGALLLTVEDAIVWEVMAS